MDPKIIRLPGLTINFQDKWYCNYIDESEARCSDVYTENGSHIQYVNHYTLTGLESWKYNELTKCYYFHMPDKYFDEIDGGAFDSMLCTHFRWTHNISAPPLFMFSGGLTNEIQFNYDNGIGGLENFINWIKKQLDTKIPVQIEYILKYPIYHVPYQHKRTLEYVKNALINSTIK